MKNEIPPRQVETEIAVGLPPENGMMDAVHIGCYQKNPQQSIELRRNLDVAVIKHRHCIQNNFENQD